MQIAGGQSSGAWAVIITAVIIMTSLYFTYENEAESTKLRIRHQLLNPGLHLPSWLTLDKLSNVSEPHSPHLWIKRYLMGVLSVWPMVDTREIAAIIITFV